MHGQNHIKYLYVVPQSLHANDGILSQLGRYFFF